MKQNKTMYSEILSQIQTTDDLETLKSEIDYLKQSNYNSKNSFDDILTTKVRKKIADQISQEIFNTKQSSKTYIEGLEEKIRSLEKAKLILSYEPDAESMNSIFQWFSENVSKELVLDIYVNPNIVGGAQISFKGKYYDGSLSSKINKLYQSTTKDNSNNRK